MLRSPQQRVKPKWLQLPELKTVFSIVSEAGGQVRVAGGAVRNALLRLPPGDIDLATTLSPENVSSAFRKHGHLVIPTGIGHGTVTVRVKDRLFEITTLRKDVITDGRRAQVVFTDDWIADAARRDFTINAMYLSKGGLLFDYFDGLRDLRKRHVRFVGKPETRIREDYLRVLRFFRFQAIYGGKNIDLAALLACAKLRKHLTQLSAERVRGEVLKLLEAPDPTRILEEMHARGILKIVLPEPGFRIPADLGKLARLPRDGILRLSVFVADLSIAQPVLRLSNAETGRIAAILNGPVLSPTLKQSECRSIIYTIGAEAFRDAVHFHRASRDANSSPRRWEALLRFAIKWQKPRFPLSGKDLLGLGMKPGPSTGQALKKLEDWWIASDFKANAEDLLKKL
jgi:poly(A) polymerase